MKESLQTAYDALIMAIKDLFSAEEWTALRDAPQFIGLATALAGSSGILGTMGEILAASEIIAQGSKSSDEVIRTLAGDDEVKAALQSLQALVKSGGAADKDTVQKSALEMLRQAMLALYAKAPATAPAYRTWVGDIAQFVAERSKEGGFLGFGGERISEGERAFLDRLQSIR